MKNLCRYFVVLMAALVVGSMAQAQTSRPKQERVAVYVSGMSDAVNEAVRSYFLDKITEYEQYTIAERADDFVQMINSERDLQVSGDVKESQIYKVGEDLGVRYIFAVKLSEVLDNYVFAARMLDVQTKGLVPKGSLTKRGVIESFDDLEALAIATINELMMRVSEGGMSSGGGYSSGGGFSSNNSGSNGSAKTFNVKGVNFKMIFVQGGTYTMGCTSEQGGDCYDDERPAHTEMVSNFYIGETEVTQDLWMAVMGTNPSYFKGANLPVEQVSWEDCQLFIQKLNQLTGQRFRLPTEAEWEFAARGGNKSNQYKYSGSSSCGAVAWFGNSNGSTHAVALLQPNELGIYDMSGNVYEWCQDCWRSNYGASEDCSRRVLRGGSWNYGAGSCRVACRNRSTPSYRGSYNGLRLAL